VEHLVVGRIEDRSRDEALFVLDSDRYRERRHTVNEVRRPVERIDDPAIAAALGARRALLGHDRVIGVT
jgi:hypothetical protein